MKSNPIKWFSERVPAGLVLTHLEAYQKAGQALRAHGMFSDKSDKCRMINQLQADKVIAPIIIGPRGARGFRRLP